MSDDVKFGTYRTVQPGEQIPPEYVAIPMYMTEHQKEALYLKVAAERAKDVTPKD